MDENFRVRHLRENFTPILLAKQLSRRLVSQRQKTKHGDVVSRHWDSRAAAGFARAQRLAPSLWQERLKIMSGDTKARAHFVHHFSAHERIMDARYSLGEASGQLRLRAYGSKIDISRLTFDPVIEKITCDRDAFLELLFSFPANQTVRIFTGRHLRHTHNQIILKESIQRTFGCLRPGSVRIEAKNDFIDKTL